MNRYSTVFLDLDDTLYPSSNGVWDAIGERINLFMMERLAIEPDRVRVLRDSYFRNYGTTLHGLMANHGQRLIAVNYCQIVRKKQKLKNLRSYQDEIRYFSNI